MGVTAVPAVLAAFWSFPGQRGMFALLGVRGEAIYVDPASRLVMVHTAVRKRPVDLAGAQELGALWRSLVRDLPAN